MHKDGMIILEKNLPNCPSGYSGIVKEENVDTLKHEKVRKGAVQVKVGRQTFHLHEIEMKCILVIGKDILGKVQIEKVK